MNCKFTMILALLNCKPHILKYQAPSPSETLSHTTLVWRCWLRQTQTQFLVPPWPLKLEKKML